jgi:hypothetical protein
LKPAIVFYTCVAGAYDAWRGLDRPAADAGYVYFSDSLPPGPKDGWDVRSIPEFARRQKAKDTSRFIKMHPHLLFPEHSASVYVDGTICCGAKNSSCIALAEATRGFATAISVSKPRIRDRPSPASSK